MVVDDGGSFGAGEFADQLLDQIITVATAASLQVVFQIGGVGQGFDHGIYGFLRQQGAAQVGVQHGAREVEHRFEAWCKALSQALLHSGGQYSFLHLLGLQRAITQLQTQGIQHLPNCIGHAGAAKFSLQALQDGGL